MNKAYLESEYNIGYFIENVEGNSYGMLHEMSFQNSFSCNSYSYSTFTTKLLIIC